jgi:pilus assembly protein CpaB
MPKAESKNGVRALVFLALAFVSGLAATVIVATSVAAWEQRLDEARREEPTAIVMVAAADLYPGVVITENDVIGVTFDADEAPSWAFGAPQLVIGRVPQERILANEPIHPARLADATTGEGLNVLVEPGMRALALDLANGAQLSGHLTPGSIVDVLVTIRPEQGEPTTTTVAQSVPVLAVNDRALGDQPEDGKKSKKKKKGAAVKPSVTVMVTPEVAEQLAFASQKGEMTLALRGTGDTSYATVSLVETPDLLPPPPPEPEKPKKKRTPPPPPEPTLQICEGTKCRDVVIPK